MSRSSGLGFGERSLKVVPEDFVTLMSSKPRDS